MKVSAGRASAVAWRASMSDGGQAAGSQHLMGMFLSRVSRLRTMTISRPTMRSGSIRFLSRGASGVKGDQGDPGPSTGPAGGDLTGNYPNPALAATPAARAYWSGTDGCNIDIANNTDVRIGWSDQSFDNKDGTADEMFTGQCAPTSARMTAPRDGVYAVNAALIWAANATGARELKLKRNGSTLVASVRGAAAPTGTTIQNVSRVLRMVKGDYVELYAAQDSGATRQLSDFGSQNNFMAMYWVTP